MGTFYKTGATKADVVREITAPYHSDTGSVYRTLKHKVVDDALYAVKEATAPDGSTGTNIVVYVLSQHHGSWGYKPMDECMHPYWYACPFSFLKLAPVTSQAWRDGVKEYHAAKKRP